MFVRGKTELGIERACLTFATCPESSPRANYDSEETQVHTGRLTRLLNLIQGASRRSGARDRPCETRRDKIPDIGRCASERSRSAQQLNKQDTRENRPRSEYRSRGAWRTPREIGRSRPAREKRERAAVPMSAFAHRCEERGSTRIRRGLC